MTLGLHEGRMRDRRRRRWSFLRLVVVLAIIGALGFYAYETGSGLAQRDVQRLRTELVTLNDEAADLRKENAVLRVAVATANRSAAQWEKRYAGDVPTGKPKEFLDRIQEKLAAGISAERLALVIDAASDDGDCAGKPLTKRFILPTPLYQGAAGSVGFANNAITITGEGLPSVNEDGRPEAWFDPAQPATIIFTLLGGKRSQVKGALPLHHSVIVDKTEYRFSIVAGDRGFVKVTGDRCRFQ